MDLLPTDPIKIWTFIIVGLSFVLYIGIAWRAKAESTSDFYVAGSRVGAVANGMATAAGWMSAGLVYLNGRHDVLPGARRCHVSDGLDGRVCAPGPVACALPTKVSGNIRCRTLWANAITRRPPGSPRSCAPSLSRLPMWPVRCAGSGVVFARFLEVPVELGVVIGMAIVFIYAVTGGQKGITYTQVAQYSVLIFAYMFAHLFYLSADDRYAAAPNRFRGGTDNRARHVSAG